MTDTFIGRPEVFWVGLQTISAICGFVGLLVYIHFTRKQARLAFETRRAEILPYLVLEPPEDAEANVEFGLRNVGGPAVNIFGWTKVVSDDFELGQMLVVKPASEPTQFVGAIDRQQTKWIEPKDEAVGQRTLYVFEVRDLLDRRHQFAVIRDRRPMKLHNTEAQFVWDGRYLPFRDRFASKLYELKDRFRIMATR